MAGGARRIGAADRSRRRPAVMATVASRASLPVEGVLDLPWRCAAERGFRMRRSPTLTLPSLPRPREDGRLPLEATSGVAMRADQEEPKKDLDPSSCLARHGYLLFRAAF